jgi:uncharacterized membrane protein
MIAMVALVAWALSHLYGGRAVYMQVGAMLGTIMAANVLMVIIPSQRKLVEAKEQGVAPDPVYGRHGKQRSVHNNYFTLPVLFIMISNHYPMTYSHPHGWLVLGVIMLAGVLIRQFFVLRHKGRTLWLFPALAVLLLIGVAAALAPSPVAIPAKSAGVTFAQLKTVLDTRCVACHATQPTQPGFAQPPKGVVLETPEQIGQNAAKVAETVANRYMPIGNLTQMTDEERAIVAAWFAQGAKR